jgi:hypothetical protein
LAFFLWALPAFSSLPAGPQDGADQGEQQAAGRKNADLEAEWGIRVVSLRQTANGHLLDFRYRVVDPEKAATLLRREEKPFLIDEATGKRFPVPQMPKIGALRQSSIAPEAGKVYFILFKNPFGLLKSGSRVTVVIGKFKAEHLVVD